jgi:hypothetical protein
MHPLTLYSIRSFLQPGKTDIVMDALEAPVEFHEVHTQAYLVQCSVKARLVVLPLITSADPYQRNKPSLMDFPEEIGTILQIARGKHSFFVLSKEETSTKLHVLSHQLKRTADPFEIPHETLCLAYSSGLLVLGGMGSLTVLQVVEDGVRATISTDFSHPIGESPLSWIAVYSRGKQWVVVAIQGQELVIIRNLFSVLSMNRVSLDLLEGCKPFFHGGYLLWKGSEGFKCLDLEDNDKLHTFSEWVYVHPVADHQLLVQDKECHVFLVNEEMQSLWVGSLPTPVLAADFRNDYLLVAYEDSKISLYYLHCQVLQEIYQDCIQTVDKEKIIQVSFNIAGTITYSTNNGRFIYGCPIFEGLEKKDAAIAPAPAPKSWCSLV